MELNDVAWFFYWANIIPNIGSLAIVLSVVMFFILVGIGIGMWAYWFENRHSVELLTKYYYDLKEKDFIAQTYKPLNFYAPLAISFALILLWSVFPLIAVFTPSSDTIYKMGASVVGEQIIQLEQVQEIGGEVGSLANDTIEMLRSHIQNATVAEE